MIKLTSCYLVISPCGINTYLCNTENESRNPFLQVLWAFLHWSWKHRSWLHLIGNDPTDANISSFSCFSPRCRYVFCVFKFTCHSLWRKWNKIIANWIHSCRSSTDVFNWWKWHLWWVINHNILNHPVFFVFLGACLLKCLVCSVCSWRSWYIYNSDHVVCLLMQQLIIHEN